MEWRHAPAVTLTGTFPPDAGVEFVSVIVRAVGTTDRPAQQPAEAVSLCPEPMFNVSGDAQ